MDVVLRFSVWHVDSLSTYHFNILCMYRFVRVDTSLANAIGSVFAVGPWQSSSFLSRVNPNLMN